MNSKKEVQHVYLVGAKSLGAYGGYETFVYKLTEYHQNKENIKYHVACKANGDGCMDESKFDGVTKINEHEFELHNAHCFKIDVPQIGPAQAIYYDVAALKACCEHIKENHIPHPIVYIMACRIGPFAGHFYKEIHKLGGTVYLNPDGHEWMRAKWSAPIRKYWKISEQMMVKYCDLAICDSVNIEKYIHECYDGKGIKGRNPKTTFIAYGADLTLSKLADDDEKLVSWYKEKGLTKKDYYLVVGRFVPENSFEVMIREFMKSKSQKDFAIITNVNDKFLNELEEKLHFKSDKRIKFVGTVYDQELLKKIRENAYIQREKCFCINFLPISYYDKLVDTINQNEYEADEFSVGKFSLENAKTIHAPMIQEAFINMECTLKETQDLSGAGITSMIIGQVQHISVEEEYSKGYEKRYGKDGFMMLIPAPQDLKTGEPNQSAIATVSIEKFD